MPPRHLFRLLLILALLGLAGCANHAGALYNAPPPPSLDESLDEAMVQMVEEFPELEEHGPMVAASLIDLDDPQATTTLGRLAAEMAAASLARAGVPMREVLLEGSDLMSTQGGMAGPLRRTLRRLDVEGAEAVLLGTYAAGHDRLYLTLRVVAARNATVLGSTSLGLVMDENLRELLQPD